MGVLVYWLIVAAVIVFGFIMPQQGEKKKHYIILMAVLHTFVCGFRYMYLTGDLRKYAWEYSTMNNYGWFSNNVFHGGRNAGFYWLMKLVCDLTNGDFQIFLILLAVITQVIVAVLIYRYSPKPWLSYLVWNCMAFYVIYGFSTIKQGLVMSVLMCAMMCIFDKKPIKFLIFVLLAGFIHMPALVFLPAYFIANRKLNSYSFIGYFIFAVAVFLFKNQIVNFISGLYYENESFTSSGGIGGRFLLIVLFLIGGILFKGFKEKNFEILFNIIIIGAILQMFSFFDNVFTRFADCYLQFLVLFIPMMFYKDEKNTTLIPDANDAVLSLNEKNVQLIVLALTAFFIFYYNKTCIGVNIANINDDYTNFRFMWDVTS